MKVGILTYHSALNYGAILQAYALQETLKTKKVEVEIIDFKPVNPENSHKITLKNLRGFISRTLQFHILKPRREAFREFINKNISMSKVTFFDKELLYKNVHEYDVIITGSDQVWNPNYTKGLLEVYFLSFNNSNVKKVSYAASIGNAKYSEEDKKNITTWLGTFSKISVRENKAFNELKSLVRRDISVNIDPTLLLSSDEWLKAVNNELNPIPSEEYILVYGLEKNNEFVKIANNLSRITNLKIVHFGKRKMYNNELIRLYKHGPSTFIQAFSNAKYVITNSFHGTVFSIIFKKQFINIPHSDNNSRMDELLNYLNLKDQVMNNIEDVKKIFNEINYIEVDSLLKERIKESNDYINEALLVKFKD